LRYILFLLGDEMMLTVKNAVKFSLVLAFSLFLLFAVTPVEAAEILTGDNMTIGPGETIDDDLYVFGDTIVISGTILGDAVVFGREVIVDGQVSGNLLVFAETIRINGEVAGTIRGGANNIFFQGTTGRDLMMAANSITVSGTIGQDYFAAASSSAVTGSVGRDIRASINRLAIDAPVGGDVHVVVGDLTFGSGAAVDGLVNYTSENEAVVDSKAVILGSLNRFDPPTNDMTAVSQRSSVWGFVRPILSLLALALLMILVFPGLCKGTAQVIKEQPGKSAGAGAIVLFATPFAALLLLITVIGAPISMLSMLLYIVVICLSRVFAGYFLAQLVLDRVGKQLHPVLTMLGGVLVLALLFKIPYIGWILQLAAVLFAAGAFIIYLYGKQEKEIASPELLQQQAE
jgi:cytoskeletal protein CcmA (bactofilin family)